MDLPRRTLELGSSPYLPGQRRTGFREAQYSLNACQQLGHAILALVQGNNDRLRARCAQSGQIRRQTTADCKPGRCLPAREWQSVWPSNHQCNHRCELIERDSQSPTLFAKKLRKGWVTPSRSYLVPVSPTERNRVFSSKRSFLLGVLICCTLRLPKMFNGVAESPVNSAVWRAVIPWSRSAHPR